MINQTINGWEIAKYENDIKVQERIIETFQIEMEEMTEDMSLVHIYFRESAIVQYSRDEFHTLIDLIGKLKPSKNTIQLFQLIHIGWCPELVFISVVFSISTNLAVVILNSSVLKIYFVR